MILLMFLTHLKENMTFWCSLDNVALCLGVIAGLAAASWCILGLAALAAGHPDAIKCFRDGTISIFVCAGAGVASSLIEQHNQCNQLPP